MKKIKKYYYLAKPGIVYGNVLSSIAGFLFASKTNINFLLFIYLILGESLIIGSACVFNNVIDRKIDGKMDRTKKRATVTGEISPIKAIIFASVLGIVGMLILIVHVNILTALIGFFGFLIYVVFYGISKRITIWGTVIGSFSGSMPIVAGYTAFTNRIDIAAILLFLILASWQMPHFYGIAIYHLEEYTKAGLVLWPIKKGIESTKIQILVYILIFLASSFLLVYFKYKGFVFFLIMLILGIFWLREYLNEKHMKDINKWGRNMFLFSLIMLLVTSVALAIPWI